MARVLFLQNFWFEFLGTMYLSAVLKQDGHACDLLIEGGEKDFLGAIRACEPDLIGFYCTTGAHLWATETAARIKRELPGVRIALGGPHPTYFPDVVEHPAIDFVCRGEGEMAMRELARRLSAGEPCNDIPNLWAKSDGQVHRNPVGMLLRDLDALPYPDRALYYRRYRLLRDSPNKHFITGRGCPYSCSFCCNKAYNELYRGSGPVVRRLSPQRVLDEINSVAAEYPLKAVRFDDEVFLLKPSWLKEFLAEYRRQVGIPFTCLIRADLADAQRVRWLREAGCYAAYFGIESGDECLRNRVLGKRISRDEILSTAAALRREGISIGTFNMVGIPGETLEQAYETVRLNQLVRTDLPWCSIVQPYPATELLDYAVAEGYIEPGMAAESFCQSYFNRSVVKNRDTNELVNLHKFFYIAVKAPWLFPLIRLLVKLPPNRLFDWVFSATFAYRYMKTYRVPFLRLLRAAVFLKDNY
jgi:anaerobic magnesium-protoporphyrin IX monomethyl ester cyclase